MTILKAQIIGGNNLIGVYMEANNSYVLYPPDLLKPIYKKFKSAFDLDFYPLTINNSNLLGVYISSNSHGIIVPHVIRDDELNLLNGFINEVDDSIQIGVLKSIDNAFGNLILCNDKGAIISSLLGEFQKEIEDILNVETIIHEFAGSFLPGSISLANNNGCVVHPLSTDEEIEFITSILKVKETDVSTINRGLPYLGSGAVVNDSCGIFGERSTGPEMMRLSNVLGL